MKNNVKILITVIIAIIIVISLFFLLGNNSFKTSNILQKIDVPPKSESYDEYLIKYGKETVPDDKVQIEAANYSKGDSALLRCGKEIFLQPKNFLLNQVVITKLCICLLYPYDNSGGYPYSNWNIQLRHLYILKRRY